MDANRDDRVSLAEFASFLQQKGYGEIEHNMFRQLDANGDGELDFDEVLTFYYIVKTRWIRRRRKKKKKLFFLFCINVP